MGTGAKRRKDAIRIDETSGSSKRRVSDGGKERTIVRGLKTYRLRLGSEDQSYRPSLSDNASRHSVSNGRVALRNDTARHGVADGGVRLGDSATGHGVSDGRVSFSDDASGHGVADSRVGFGDDASRHSVSDSGVGDHGVRK